MTARPRILAALAALSLAALTIVIVVIVAGRSRSSHDLRTLEIEMRTSAGTAARLYWSADDATLVDERSIERPLRPDPEGFQLLRFPLPARGVRSLGFEPTNAPADVLIAKVNVLDANGQVLQAFDPGIFTAGNQIASITRQRGFARVVTAPAASVPFLYAAVGCLDSPSVRESLSLVTPATLALVSILVIALLTASVLVIGRDAFAPEQNVGSPHASGPSWRLPALWMTALFLIVFSAKLLLMRENPVTSPFWDQWDAEADVLFVPWNQCNLAWQTMFGLHNEHRVFFTRLLALDLLAVNGQWDPRLEQVVNAVTHALTAVLVVVFFWVIGERRRLDLLVFLGALTFALPFSWENTLAGFQSAFYFLLLFSVLALWLTTRHRPGSGPWWLGWLAAVCGIFTAASGLLIPLAIAGMIALKLADDWRGWREALINGLAAVLVFAFGYSMAAPPLQQDAYLKAATAGEFAGAFGHGLAWPWIQFPLMSIVMWLPLGALLTAALLRRGKTTGFERFIVGLSIWVVLHAAALAYGRGAGSALPQSRYQDFLSLGFVANTMALLVGLDRTRGDKAARRVALGVLVSWLLIGSVGIDRRTGSALTDVSAWRPLFSAHAVNVRRYLVTGDRAQFLAKRPLLDLPYPFQERLATLLDNADIRRILPVSMREPIPVEPRIVTNDAFVSEGTYPITPRDPLARGWGSYSIRGNPGQGRFESQPIASCPFGALLQFQVAGYLGSPQQYLAVRDLQSGREREVRPGRLAREDWMDVLVSCPAGPYTIIAVDATPDTWFAFREPVEIGWASSLAESLIGGSRELLLASLALVVLLARWT